MNPHHCALPDRWSCSEGETVFWWWSNHGCQRPLQPAVAPQPVSPSPLDHQSGNTHSHSVTAGALLINPFWPPRPKTTNCQTNHCMEINISFFPFSQVFLKVFLDDAETQLSEVPITPATTCADVVEFCKAPSEEHCHLSELWRGCGKFPNNN